MKCQVCKRGNRKRPMIFRGQSYCSDNCRKELEGE